MEKQAVVLGDGTDADVVAFAEDELEAAVQVFHVRGGRVRGQRGWVVEKRSRTPPRGWSSTSCSRSTAASRPARRVPREVLVPALPPDAEAARAAGSAGCAGPRVDLRVPQRGDKRALMETVAPQRRAGAGAAQDRARRRPDRPQPGAAGDAGGPRAATTRRCGSSATTSPTSRAPTWSRRWWSSRTGWPRKSEYRRFIVRGDGRRCSGAVRTDDTAAMHEVLTRRFRRYLDERERPARGIGSGDRVDDRDEPSAPATVRRASGPAGSTRTPAGRASSPTRRTSSSSTAARRRSRGRAPRWPSSASTTSPLVRAGQAAGGGLAARRGRTR